MAECTRYVISVIVVYHYSKQVGEEEEQGGENTPNIHVEQDFKTSIGMLL